MVTITGVELRTNSKGEDFVALILQGDLEMVKSKSSGKFYATARKISIPSTFDQKTAENHVGRQLPGEIQRIEVPPYEYTTPKGEVLLLEHSYVYNPNPRSMEQEVFEGNPHFE